MTVTLHETLLPVPELPFISTWQTTAADETITLPLDATGATHYNFVVDWGDGTPTSVVTSGADPNKTHKYTTPGNHTVKITGTIQGWSFNDAGDKLKIRAINQWGCLRFLNFETGHFFGCQNIQILAADKPTLNVSLTHMFEGCTNLFVVNGLSDWDVSHVNNMGSMFKDCKVFDAPLTNWNTLSLAATPGMFDGCSIFNHPVDHFKMSNVHNMANMFRDCHKFNQSVNNWDTQLVNNMSGVFNSCWEFNQPLNNWKTSKVTTFAGMFFDCKVFDQDITMWDTSSATTMPGMFDGALVFNRNLNNWKVDKVTDLTRTFRNTHLFNSPLDKWNVSNVTKFDTTFESAKAFNQDVSMWDVAKSVTFRLMFSNASVFNCGLAPGVVHNKMNRTATGGWRTGLCKDFFSMITLTPAWAGDLSSWCVPVPAPVVFSGSHANFNPATMAPKWGTCPIPN